MARKLFSLVYVHQTVVARPTLVLIMVMYGSHMPASVSCDRFSGVWGPGVSIVLGSGGRHPILRVGIVKEMMIIYLCIFEKLYEIYSSLNSIMSRVVHV